METTFKAFQVRYKPGGATGLITGKSVYADSRPCYLFEPDSVVFAGLKGWITSDNFEPYQDAAELVISTIHDPLTTKDIADDLLGTEPTPLPYGLYSGYRAKKRAEKASLAEEKKPNPRFRITSTHGEYFVIGPGPKGGRGTYAKLNHQAHAIALCALLNGDPGAAEDAIDDWLDDVPEAP